MSIFKSVIGTLVILFLLLFSFGSIVSCTKTEIVKDTTYYVIKDTIVKKDTVYDLKDGLVAYYNFLNGNLNDSSGFGNNIVFNNAVPTADRFGHPNSAFTFSNGAYMRVNNSSSLNPSPVTLMAVVKFNGFYTGLGWGTQVFMKGPSDQSNGVYGIRAHPMSFDLSQPIDTSTEMLAPFYGNGASSIFDYSENLVSGNWYTIVYTYDGSQAKVYLNGILKQAQTQAIAFSPNLNDLYIGKTENLDYPYNFTGDIDEIRIYHKALSAQLIQQFNNLTY